MSRITRLSLLHSAESSPLAASHVYWQASLDGTHRWQQALGWAALATPATGMGCLCGPCFAARRVERGSLSVFGPPLGCSVDNSRARRRMLWRAARRLCRSNYVVAPRTLMQKLSRHITSDRALYSRCGPKKVREQFTISAAPRGLPRALPKTSKNCFPTWAKRVAYAPRARPLTAATHR